MSEKKVGKRLLTWVLVLVMTLSLLPLNVLADEIPETDNTPGKVTATKSCTTEPDSNGNYTITLTVQGNPVPSTDTMTTPANADVVLVVDNSGSMESKVGTPCEAPKNSFKNIDPLEIGALVQCQFCDAKYLWPFIPDVCTGQTGVTKRIVAATNVSKEFASSILSYNGNQVAVIGFAHGDRGGGADEKAIKVKQELTNSIDSINTAIERMEADGGTNYTAALDKAYTYLNSRSDKTRPGYVIFISDGAPGLSGESQDDPDWNGFNQAESIKRDNYTLYTVGIALDDSAAAYLKSMASDDQNEHFINVTGTDYEAQLKKTLQQWADKIKETPTTKPAGTGAVLTDVINTKQFEYVEGSATGGLTVGEDSEGNKTVTWNIGEIPEKDASVSFKIKAWAGFWGDGIHTNENVTLTYTNAKDELATMGKDVIGDPMVDIAAPTFTVTYNANGGSGAPAAVSDNKAGDTVDLDYINQPTHAQQDGKNVIFIGWTTDTNKKVYTNGESLPDLMMKATFVDSDITVYAVWGLDENGNGVPDALEAKVTYKIKNGHWFNAATGQAAGSEIVCLRPLYKKSASGVWEPCSATLGDSIPTGRAGEAGYTADGWYKDAETTTTTIDAATPVTGNVTYTFKYVPETKPDTYTVVLHLVGGTYTTAPGYTPTADGYQYSLSATTGKVNPTKTTLNKNGYEFKGWSLSETAPQTLIGADETFASLSVQQNGLNGNHGKIDLYAVWQEIKYTVTYNLDGGTTTSKETTFSDLIYGIKTPTIKEPSKAGYTFAGWEPKVAETVTKDVTYKAKWNAIYVPYYPPVPPTVKIEDDDALGLNTTDHFAYIVGYGNGEVRPQNNITRAEVATIFFRLLTDDVRDENLTKTNRYSDVAATSWYNTAVSTLSSMGIITGYPDGTFRPNAAITRAEFAAIAARFDNDGDKTAAKFSDIATHWAKDEISIAYNNGWITGYPDGTFGPQRDITRAETMTLVNRVLNRQPETEDDLLPNMTVWTDNANQKAWYYLAVQEATNSHYYKFKTNSKYEKWTELRETRDWTQLEK